MREILLLTRLELCSLYGINRFLHTKDPREKKRGWLMVFAWVILLMTSVFYIGGLSYGLVMVNAASAVPVYLAVLSGGLILAVGIFGAGNRVFGDKGYDLLFSMPVKAHHVVLCRFSVMYLEDLLFTLTVFLPGATVYCLFARPSWVFYVGLGCTIWFLPLIPMCISLLFGTLTLAIISRVKHKSWIQAAIGIAVVIGVMIPSMFSAQLTENITDEELLLLLSNVGERLGRFYPPALWFAEGTAGNVLYALLLAGVSAALTAVAALAALWLFRPIVTGLGRRGGGQHFSLSRQKQTGLTGTMLKREWRRYTASGIYITNTVIGPILGAVLPIVLLITGVDKIAASMPPIFDIAAAIPFLIGAVFTMMTTTSVSISMEGKQMDVLRSLPVSEKNLFDGKILLHLCLCAPFYLPAQILLAIALRPTPLALLWQILIPLCLILFASVAGLFINIKLHSFEWTNEAAVVKQSMPAMLGGFAGPFVALLSAFSTLFLPTPWDHVGKALVCLVLLGATALLYRGSIRTRLCDL